MSQRIPLLGENLCGWFKIHEIRNFLPPIVSHRVVVCYCTMCTTCQCLRSCMKQNISRKNLFRNLMPNQNLIKREINFCTAPLQYKMSLLEKVHRIHNCRLLLPYVKCRGFLLQMFPARSHGSFPL